MLGWKPAGTGISRGTPRSPSSCATPGNPRFAADPHRVSVVVGGVEIRENLGIRRRHRVLDGSRPRALIA